VLARIHYDPLGAGSNKESDRTAISEADPCIRPLHLGALDGSVLTLAARQYCSGESFLAEFEERAKSYNRWIQIYPGDLTQIGWNDGPIEFLMVDAMKSLDLAKFIVREFYGKILPAKGLLFHQDFKFYYTSWIHLIQYRLRDYFALETSVKESAAVVFRLNKPFDCNLSWLDQLDSISDDEVESAFEYSMSLVGTEVANVAAAKVMHFIHAGRLDRAKNELERFFQAGFPKDSELSICATHLEAIRRSTDASPRNQSLLPS
jgi:hypothetical protein